MKPNFLTILGTVAILTVSCNTNSPSTQASPPEETASPVQTADTSAPETPAASPASRSGTFVKSEKPTQGMAAIITENGQNYLVLDEEFNTGDGPDVFVLLHKESSPTNYQDTDYVNLGKLETTSGSQRYAIPADVDPADFSSVVIWCRQFNATFGYATLGS